MRAPRVPKWSARAVATDLSLGRRELLIGRRISSGAFALVYIGRYRGQVRGAAVRTGAACVWASARGAVPCVSQHTRLRRAARRLRTARRARDGQHEAAPGLGRAAAVARCQAWSLVTMCHPRTLGDPRLDAARLASPHADGACTTVRGRQGASLRAHGTAELRAFYQSPAAGAPSSQRAEARAPGDLHQGGEPHQQFQPPERPPLRRRLLRASSRLHRYPCRAPAAPHGR